MARFELVANCHVNLTIIPYIKVDGIRLNYQCHIKPIHIWSDLILVELWLSVWPVALF